MPSRPLPPCVLEHHTSHDMEPALRRDAWREIAHWLVDYRPSPDVPLDADMLILRSRACIFGSTRSSAYEMRTGLIPQAPVEDMVVVSLIQAGELRLNAASGEDQRVAAGTLGLFVPRLPGHYRLSHNARQAFIDLPRRDVLAALGREPGNLPIALERCALAPALASQLNQLALMARQPYRIDTTEYAGLLEGTRALALLTLRNLGRHGEGVDLPDVEEDLNRGRHAAALRFMAREAHRHDLDVAVIAHGAGCSRTRLYEAFAAQGATVMGTLREMRLMRARELIEESPRLHAGAISWRCGFADQSAFSKLFKARFGLLPSEWHRQVWMSRGIKTPDGATP